MTSERALDDSKRGFPTTVGPLVRLIQRHRVQVFVTLSREERDRARELLTASAGFQTEEVGGQLSILDALDQLTPGQTTLLRARVRR